jgi:hypothetical protein
MVQQAHAKSKCVDLDAVADVQPQQSGRIEIYQDVISAAVLAGNEADRAGTRAAGHPREVADARAGQQGHVGSIARPDDLPAVVVQSYAGFNVVTRETDTPIADTSIDRDPTRAG